MTRDDALKQAISNAASRRVIFVVYLNENTGEWFSIPYSDTHDNETHFGETRYILPRGQVTKLS